MTDIPEGYGLIPGRGTENARKALAAAEAAGVDPTLVRTVDDGYLAPLKVLDAFEAAEKKKSEPKADAKEPAPKKPAAKKPATTTKKES